MSFQIQLKSDDRETLADVLQATVIDLIAYSLIAKQAHWNVIGTNFRPVHQQLDEIYEATQTQIDLIAERMVVLGFSPNGQAADVSYSALKEFERGFIKDASVVIQMAERTHELASHMRERVAIIEDLDVVTADMYHAMLESIEKNLWMLRAQIQ
jgi:starvation-inducible DNA-binding protein